MDALQRAARLQVFERFAETGAPPSATEAAEALGIPRADLLAAWRALHDAHQLVLAPAGDSVRMAHPFSALPMGFVVRAEGDEMWWGGCAWDSFGVAAALRRTVEIVTRCPWCGATLAPRVGWAQGPPASLAIALPLPASRWWDDVVATCTNIRLCCDSAHAHAHAAAAGHDEGEVVSAERLWRLAVGWYGDRLEPEYEPQTREKRMEQLAAAGLTGPFWELP